MHYKNGRTAQIADPVIGKSYGQFLAGTLHSIYPENTTCNGTVAVPIPGGVQQMAATVGELFHAEDAFNAIEATMPANTPAEPGPHSVAEQPAKPN